MEEEIFGNKEEIATGRVIKRQVIGSLWQLYTKKEITTRE